MRDDKDLKEIRKAKEKDVKTRAKAYKEVGKAEARVEEADEKTRRKIGEAENIRTTRDEEEY